MDTERVEIPTEAERPQPGRSATAASADAVDRRRNAKLQSATLTVLATGAVLTLMYFAKPVLVTVLASVLISFMLAPVVDVLERLRFPKALSSLIAVLLLCGICYGITYVSYNRAVQFVQDLPQYSSKIRHVFLRFQKQAETIQRTTENVLPD